MCGAQPVQRDDPGTTKERYSMRNHTAPRHLTILILTLILPALWLTAGCQAAAESEGPPGFPDAGEMPSFPEQPKLELAQGETYYSGTSGLGRCRSAEVELILTAGKDGIHDVSVTLMDCSVTVERGNTRVEQTVGSLKTTSAGSHEVTGGAARVSLGPDGSLDFTRLGDQTAMCSLEYSLEVDMGHAGSIGGSSSPFSGGIGISSDKVRVPLGTSQITLTASTTIP